MIRDVCVQKDPILLKVYPNVAVWVTPLSSSIVNYLSIYLHEEIKAGIAEKILSHVLVTVSYGQLDVNEKKSRKTERKNIPSVCKVKEGAVLEKI